nr:hypothetical protein [uncultured Brevundimonas sp.]
MTADDRRPDLPGSAEPPLEGRRWFWIKVGAWGASILLLIAAAAVASLGISSLLTRGAAPGAPDRVVVEEVAPPVAAARDSPSAASPVEPPQETMGVNAMQVVTPNEDVKPTRRPLMRH